MAHYAFLDSNNIVTEVIVGRDDGDIDWEKFYGDERGQVCKKTSYNSAGGDHLFGGKSFRKNYASIGYIYDEEKDAFIPPKPYSSWVLNEQTCCWDPPVEIPLDSKDGVMYLWNEDTQTWDLNSSV